MAIFDLFIKEVMGSVLVIEDREEDYVIKWG
ncbi:hypothetical protein CCACVL1_30614 [Corchorus capsularis]|uniref:Uncharacterized protein n=1 Tax=Corchorus capsularis TaxID=210143 RepID=A0A1R3FWA8_COCAP|nr:hypothetical protein CCACVL1_30614 [Corchorus capsularis]